jgi:hypothetical protein
MFQRLVPQQMGRSQPAMCHRDWTVDILVRTQVSRFQIHRGRPGTILEPVLILSGSSIDDKEQETPIAQPIGYRFAVPVAMPTFRYLLPRTAFHKTYGSNRLLHEHQSRPSPRWNEKAGATGCDMLPVTPPCGAKETDHEEA